MEQRQTEITDTRTGARIATLQSYYGPSLVVVKRLGWRRLEEAAEARQKAGIQAVKGYGGAEVITEFQKVVEDAQARAEAKQGLRDLVEAEKKRNPLASYDARELCLAGIDTIDGAPKSPDLIDDFELEVVEGVANAILRLSRPGLYETEDDRKNG